MKTVSTETLVQWSDWMSDLKTGDSFVYKKENNCITRSFEKDEPMTRFIPIIFILVGLSLPFVVENTELGLGCMAIFWAFATLLFIRHNKIVAKLPHKKLILDYEFGLIYHTINDEKENEISLSLSTEVVFLNLYYPDENKSDRVHCKLIQRGKSIWLYDIHKIKQFENLLQQSVQDLGGNIKIEWVSHKAENRSVYKSDFYLEERTRKKSLSTETLAQWEKWAKQVMVESPVLTAEQEKEALRLKYQDNVIKMDLAFKENFTDWIFMFLVFLLVLFTLLMFKREDFLFGILSALGTVWLTWQMWKLNAVIHRRFFPRYAVLYLEKGILTLEEGKKIETRIDLRKNIKIKFCCIYGLNEEATEPQVTDRIHCKVTERENLIWILELGHLCHQNLDRLKKFEQLLTQTIEELGGTHQVSWVRKAGAVESATGLDYTD